MYALGKLPKRTDTRTLQFAKYATALPEPPAAVDYSQIGEPYGMLGNDSVGDCTCAGAGHAEMVFGWWGEHVNEAIADQEILAAYSAITGYNPSDPSTDRGADLLSVLKYWRASGIAGMKLDAYAEVQPTATEHMKTCIDLFGCAYIGVALPDNALPTGGGIPDWTMTDMAPDPNNGHCVILVGYDAETVKVVTWGTVIRASWGFIQKYCDEAYALLSSGWATDKPSGFDFAALSADLAEIGGADPIPPEPAPSPAPGPGPFQWLLGLLEAFVHLFATPKQRGN